MSSKDWTKVQYQPVRRFTYNFDYCKKILTGEDPNGRPEHLLFRFLAKARFLKMIRNPYQETRLGLTLTFIGSVASSTVAA